MGKLFKRLLRNTLRFAVVAIAGRLLWLFLQKKQPEQREAYSLQGETAAIVLHASELLDEQSAEVCSPTALMSQTQPETPAAQELFLTGPIPVITDDLVVGLMQAADRFACTCEMATFLAIMKAGGSRQLLAGSHANTAVSDILQELACNCQDELEFVLVLYALGSASEDQALPPSLGWARDFLHYSLQALNIAAERESLLSGLAINKKEPGQRQINFDLLNRVRLVLASHLSMQSPAEVAWSSVVYIKPEWQDWLRQNTYTQLELAKFIAQCTRTEYGSLKPYDADHHLFPAYNLLQASNSGHTIYHARTAFPSVDDFPLIYSTDEDSQSEQAEINALQALRQYQIGALITGKITGILDYGAFVETETGIKGLIHKSKVWADIEDARDYFTLGETVTAAILSINEERRRLELSMRLPEYDPLLRYNPGGIAMGRVIEVRKYGVLVEIEPGVKGLLHRNEMRRSVVNVYEAFDVGDQVEVLVVSVDTERHHLSLADAAQY